MEPPGCRHSPMDSKGQTKAGATGAERLRKMPWGATLAGGVPRGHGGPLAGGQGRAWGVWEVGLEGTRGARGEARLVTGCPSALRVKSRTLQPTPRGGSIMGKSLATQGCSPNGPPGHDLLLGRELAKWVRTTGRTPMRTGPVIIGAGWALNAGWIRTQLNHPPQGDPGGYWMRRHTKHSQNRDTLAR